MIDKKEFFNPENWKFTPVTKTCRVCGVSTCRWVAVNITRGLGNVFDGFLCHECALPILSVVEEAE